MEAAGRGEHQACGPPPEFWKKLEVEREGNVQDIIP